MNLSTLLCITKPLGIGLASTAIIGGGTIIVINAITDMQQSGEVAIVGEQGGQEGQEAEAITTDSEPNVVEPEQVVEPEKITTPEPEKPTQSATHTPSKPTAPMSQPTVTPQPTPTPAPSTPTYKYTNAIEFQRAYMGWCPKDVPADAYHHALPKSIALGYMDIDYFSYKTPEEAAIYVWSWYQGARVNSVNDGSAFLDIYYDKMNAPIISNNQSYENFVIKADGYTKTVTWDTWDKNGKVKLPQDVIKAMDNVTKRIHDKMVQLDQQYYAKCGY